MSITKALTDKAGAPHSAAYVVVRSCTLDAGSKTARIIIDLYHDASAQAAGKVPFDTQTHLAIDIPEESETRTRVTGRDSDGKKIVVTETVVTLAASPAYTTYFAEDKLSPNGKTPVVQAEVWLKSLGIP